MKKILITGAGGFIGSYFVEKAVELGWDTWAAVRATTNKEFLQDPQIHFIEFDYGNKENLCNQLKDHVSRWGKWDYIIHNLGVTKCINTADFEKINYLYTRNFIEAIQQADVMPEKFIYMSSLSADVPEEDQTAYGRSKMKAEEFIRLQDDLPYLIFRPTGVYGPRDMDYLVILQTIRRGLDVAAGMKTQKLTFIYAVDLIDLIIIALASPIQKKTYAVAEGRVYTDKEYTRLAKRILGKRLVFSLRIPLPIVKLACSISEDISKKTQKPSVLNRDKYRILRRRDWTCDISPLKEDFGFVPQFSLEWGLRDSIDWYKDRKLL